jgi:hypothetical protein
MDDHENNLTRRRPAFQTKVVVWVKAFRMGLASHLKY